MAAVKNLRPRCAVENTYRRLCAFEALPVRIRLPGPGKAHPVAMHLFRHFSEKFFRFPVIDEMAELVILHGKHRRQFRCMGCLPAGIDPTLGDQFVAVHPDIAGILLLRRRNLDCRHLKSVVCCKTDERIAAYLPFIPLRNAEHIHIRRRICLEQHEDVGGGRMIETYHLRKRIGMAVFLEHIGDHRPAVGKSGVLRMHEHRALMHIGSDDQLHPVRRAAADGVDGTHRQQIILHRPRKEHAGILILMLPGNIVCTLRERVRVVIAKPLCNLVF